MKYLKSSLLLLVFAVSGTAYGLNNPESSALFASAFNGDTDGIKTLYKQGVNINALDKHGDILNGQILIGIGILLLLWTIYSNIKNTDLIIGMIFTFMQQVLYFIVAAAGAVILFLFFAAYAQAKPVYRID